MDERLSYRPAEAARAIGVGRTTLYGLVRAKAIPFFRVNGKSIRIPIDGLREWVSRQTASEGVVAPTPPVNPLADMVTRNRKPKPVVEAQSGARPRGNSLKPA